MTKFFQYCFLNANEYMLIQLCFSTKYQHWNNIGSSTLNRRNFFNVVSTLFCVDKHTLAQLSFSTKFQRWSNVGSPKLSQRNSINGVSTLICQRWKNFDQCMSAQLSFLTKYQRWNNVDQHCFNVDSTLMCLLEIPWKFCALKPRNFGVSCP